MPAQRRPLLSREFVATNRRRTFALAAAQVARESGVHGVTVTKLCRQAHAARNTFYDLFANVDDCLRHGIREGFDQLFAPVRRASDEREGEWLLGVERAIGGLYEAVAGPPDLAELFLVHSFGVPCGAGDPQYETGIVAVERLLVQGREQDATASEPMPLAETYLARVIISMATLKLHQGEAQALPAQTREMTLLVGTTYLGIEQTARILESGDVSA